MSYQLINRSAHDTGLADRSVHMVVTSPPYFGLRAYSGDQGIEWSTMEYSPMPGLPPLRIQGCEPGCAHEWADGRIVTTGNAPSATKSTLRGTGVQPGEKYSSDNVQKTTQGAYCIHCAGWRGPLGLEPTVEAYIGHLILVLRELWRVVRDDGLVFWNISDSYAGSGGAHTFDHASPGLSKSASRDGVQKYKPDGGRAPDKKVDGLRSKNLMGVPQRFMLAAQADGWIVRSALPWLKRNGLPDSTLDRPGQVVESIFMLAKSESYYFDMEAVRVPHAMTSWTAEKEARGELARGEQGIRSGAKGNARANGAADGQRSGKTSFANGGYTQSGRNFRSSDLFFKTWQGLLSSDDGDPLAMVVNPRSYTGSHFAVFPMLIPEIAIKASTSAHGVCPKCQAPYRRLVERAFMGDGNPYSYEERKVVGNKMALSGKQLAEWKEKNPDTTTGWAASCNCGCADVAPAVVLDPFNGSGTTGRAALALGRSYIGVDLSQEYLTDLAPARLSNVQIEMAF